jgi:hypothetical protein
MAGFGVATEGQWFYIVHLVFGYVTDLAIALTAFGVSSPLLRFLAKDIGQNESSTQGTVTASDLLSAIPSTLYLPIAFLLFAWIVLREYKIEVNVASD